MRRAWWLAAGAIATIGCATAFEDLDGVFQGSPDHPAIQYGALPSHDPVADLNRKLQAGEAELKFEDTSGYLRPLLEALHVPIESQIVAFAKTSVQRQRINPFNPRTLFFNDSVVVGWVHGGFIEVAAQDPEQGIVFYTLDQQSPAGDQKMKIAGRPQLVAGRGCLSCHVSYATLGVPGMLLRSVFPAPDGNALYQAGSYVTDHRSPVEQRFGGWFVTGNPGPNRHLGNAVLTNIEAPESMVTDETLHVQSLQGKFDTGYYLSPYSDLAALMVFDHQMEMMNLMVRVGWEARYALYEGQHGGATTPERLRQAVEALVDYMLFVEEAPLAGRMEGSSGFAAKFSATGPRDSQGRSLRQLDLERRLMRYPCSYMIYTSTFDALPGEAKRAIYQRMWQILSGQEHGGKYARLLPEDRRAVLEILRETKPGVAEYFR